MGYRLYPQLKLRAILSLSLRDTQTLETKAG